MRIYEQLFIVRPDATQEEIDSFLEQITGVISGAGGNVRKLEKWGVRKLAYPVEKRHEGYYVLLEYGSAPDVVKEIERRFRVSDLVLKYLTVRIDERLKWLEKRKRLRERRAQQKPAAQAAAVPGEPVAQE
ncbi:MAG: 30S ribosomal protein S6 [Bryobacterales bacterium]|nr:30S ribosomal protein S6 [Bryobacteraceae bacterium]MDW8129553.1 30S ribosomal protein S6 [Bryobacterales bacterium]